MLRGTRFIAKHIIELRYFQRIQSRSGPHLWISHRHAHSQDSTNFLPSTPNLEGVPLKLPDELLVLLDSMPDDIDSGVISQVTTEGSSLSSRCLLDDTAQIRKFAVQLAQSQLPERSMKLIQLANALGTRLKQNVYECTAHQLASSKRWREVLYVVLLGMRHTKQSTTRLLNWRTRALVEEQEYSALSSILSDFSRFKLSPNRRTYHLLLSGYIRNHDLHQAKTCLQHMLASGSPPDASTYALLASIFRPLGLDPQINSQAIASLSSLDGRGDTPTAALNGLLQMHLDSCHPSAETLHLLSLYDQPSLRSAVASSLSLDSHTEHHVATDRLSDLPPIYPNAETFCILFNHAASRNDLAAALQYIHTMSTAGIKPTGDIVASLLHVLFATGNDTTALQLVSDICGARTAHIFRRLSNTQPLPTLPILVDGILPTTQVLNALLRGVLKSNGFHAWNQILQIMRIYGLRPNATTVEVLLSYLDRVEHARPRDLLRVLSSISSMSLKPSVRHMHVIIRSILRREKYKVRGSGWKSHAFRNSKVHTAPLPPPKRLSAITEGLDPMAGFQFTTRHRHRALARPLLQSLTDRGVRSDAAMFAMRIRHDGVVQGDLDSARAVFHALLARGMRPTAYHFAALMEGHALSGDILGAEDVMQAAIESGVTPNVVMFTILIVGHARKGKPYLALRTFQRMLSAGISPDVPAIDAVASAFFAVGARGMARQVLINLWPHIQPFPPNMSTASLQDLACQFRKLHRPKPPLASLTKTQSALLRWRTARLLHKWLKLNAHPNSRLRSSKNPSNLVKSLSI